MIQGLSEEKIRELEFHNVKLKPHSTKQCELQISNIEMDRNKTIVETENNIFKLSESTGDYQILSPGHLGMKHYQSVN